MTQTRAQEEAMKDPHLRKRNGAEHRLKGGSRSLKMNFSDDQCVRRGLPTVTYKWPGESSRTIYG